MNSEAFKVRPKQQTLKYTEKFENVLFDPEVAAF